MPGFCLTCLTVFASARWVFSLLFLRVFPPSQHEDSERVAGWCWGQTTTLLLFFFSQKNTLNFMERVQFHESIKKANKNQEVTFHGSPEQLEHAKAIIWMFATRPNRGTNKSSSLPFLCANCYWTYSAGAFHKYLLIALGKCCSKRHYEAF